MPEAAAGQVAEFRLQAPAASAGFRVLGVRPNIHANIACELLVVYTFALLAGLDRAGLVLSRSEKFVYPVAGSRRRFSDWQGGLPQLLPLPLPSAFFGNIRRRFLLPVKKRAVGSL